MTQINNISFQVIHVSSNINGIWSSLDEIYKSLEKKEEKKGDV